MKEQVETYLARKAQQDLILGLREKAKVERLDKPAAWRPRAGEPRSRDEISWASGSEPMAWRSAGSARSPRPQMTRRA